MSTISLSSSMLSSKPFISKRQQSVFSFKVRARATNFYEVLALTPDIVGPLEVKRAYRSMARRYHPDACHDPSLKEEAARIFLQLHEAYETLSDPFRREEYDWELGGGERLRRSSQFQFTRRRWEDQIVELHTIRSKQHTRESWGSRMRAQFQNTEEMD